MKCCAGRYSPTPCAYGVWRLVDGRSQPLRPLRGGGPMGWHWWRRRRPANGRHTLSAPPLRVPDGDCVPVDGFRTYREIMNRAMTEPTAEVPTVPAPLIRPYVWCTEHIGRHRWWPA